MFHAVEQAASAALAAFKHTSHMPRRGPLDNWVRPFGPAKAIGSPLPPRFEEKRDARALTLVSQATHPIRMHGPRAGAGFAAANDPVETVALESLRAFAAVALSSVWRIFGANISHAFRQPLHRPLQVCSMLFGLLYADLGYKAGCQFCFFPHLK